MEKTAPATSYDDQVFSFAEILESSHEAATKQPDPLQIVASDGVKLSVYAYEPTSPAQTTLVLYHGGGAYSGGGYQYIAKGLSEKYGIAVYLPDLRGHGTSGGTRGDAPSEEQVWRDVDSVLEWINENHNYTKIYLGGHSSGGGLVLNYATAFRTTTTQNPTIDGYVLISPELGYKSETARPDRKDFAKVNILTFIANGIFGILGHSRAVKFNYPKELLQANSGLVGFNTVNMANAITPQQPANQMRALGAKPIGLWIGSDDELFDAEKVAAFVPKEKNVYNTGVVLAEKNHLGILVGVHEQIGSWIQGQDQQ
mmetsp:Transcript_4006/g.6272  ORF Transcript_4006/g.6272 Transcript_4006/m.6272 type:complete len:313 (+) Transcript_4006:81-1019(+)